MDELTIIAENLSEADKLFSDSWKLRRAHLADLADYLRRQLRESGEEEGDEEEEQVLTSLYGEFSERLRERTELSKNPELLRIVALYTRMELCKTLAESDPEKGIALWEKPGPVIAYFHNPYAGKVLQSITDVLGGGEAVDAEDYSDACEGVSDGRYDFCVLPVESARDGVMSRFVQMIDRYDLFTVLVCHLEITEEEYIRFALLSASPTCLAGADHLQLKVVTGEEQLWELLFAADQLGATLVGCRPTPGDGESQSYQLTLGVESADLAAFAYYLGMGWSRSTVNGFYRQITLSSDLGQEHYL
jgi:hypothetical protein